MKDLNESFRVTIREYPRLVIVNAKLLAMCKEFESLLCMTPGAIGALNEEGGYKLLAKVRYVIACTEKPLAVSCDDCVGIGKIRHEMDGEQDAWETCSSCNGRGEI